MTEDWEMTLEKFRKLDKKCTCPLKPEHSIFYHDWTCQICGGMHVEDICPYKDEKGFNKLIINPHFKNIVQSVLAMMIMLGVFFLGFDAAHWTSAQIQQYCFNYCLLSHTGGNFTNYTNINFTFDNISTTGITVDKVSGG